MELHLDILTEEKKNDAVRQVLDSFRKKNISTSTLSDIVDDDKLKSDRLLQISIGKISDCHHKLNSLLETFDNKIEKVIANQEEEFSKAFKFYVVKAQKELHELKDQAKEVQLQAMRDEKMIQLDAELRAAREELTKLYKKIQTQNKHITELKRTIETLKGDKEYLEGYSFNVSKEARLIKQEYLQVLEEVAALKVKNEKYEKDSTKKINAKTLESRRTTEMTKPLESIRTTLDFDSLSSKRSGRKEFSIFDSINSKRGFKSPTIKSLSSKKENMSDKENTLSLLFDDYANNHKNLDMLKASVAEMIRKIEEEKNTKINTLEASFKKNQREKLRLSQIVTTTYSEMNEYENIFVDCVRQVKKDIEQRNLFGKEFTNREDFAYIKSFKQFLSIDKAKILELLVSDEKILMKIYDSLFQTKGSLNTTTIYDNNTSMQDMSEILKGTDFEKPKVDMNLSYDVGYTRPKVPKLRLEARLFKISNGKLLKKPPLQKIEKAETQAY